MTETEKYLQTLYRLRDGRIKRLAETEKKIAEVERRIRKSQKQVSK